MTEEILVPWEPADKTGRQTTMKRTLALPFIAFALLAAACTSAGTTTTSEPSSTDPGTTEPITTDPGTTEPGDDPDDSDGSSGPVGFAPAALQQFGDCSAFLDYVHTEGAERVGPYGLGGGGYYGGPIFATDDAAVAESAPAEGDGRAVPEAPVATQAASGEERAADQASSDGSFSTTNVQVDGVDEPDIIKTDGNRIIAITGETLHYIDIAADGTTGTKRGSVTLTPTNQYAYGYEIFISGDRALVFAQGDSGFYPEPRIIDDVAVGTTSVEPSVAPTEPPAEPPVETRPAEDVPSDTIDTPEADTDAEAGLVEIQPAPDEIEAPPVDSEVPIEEGPADTDSANKEPFTVDPETLPPVSPTGYLGPQTLVIEIDMSNPDDLTVANTMLIDGRYISARSIGDTARVVVTSPPQDLGFLYPSSPETEDKAEEANRQVILESTVEDWIPEYTVIGADGSTTAGALADCANIHAPADFGGFDMLSIITLDLGSSLDAPVGTSSVMATGDTVYASADRMYVTTNIWEPIVNEQTNEWLDENYETAVHRFSIAGDGPASYEASGSIQGHLLNQFSMNDRDGVFYAATTSGAPWMGGEQSESQIVAMEISGDQLVEVGSVGGLGQGEQIYSVRYVGTTAYVVTFRQTDPFYVLDLSDPRNMSVQGELKIPGFSSYLHPISDTLVLGVGQDATEDGRTTGTKVSLFDVTDPANPLEVDVWTLPDGFSDAEFDHRAFLWWAPTNTAVLPLQSYRDRFAGAVVLKIENNTITEQGRIQHSEEEVGQVGQTDCRVITVEDLGGNEDNEFFWTIQSGGQGQLCGPNDQGGAVGLFCSPVPITDLQNYFWNGEVTIDTTGADRLELCYPDWNGYQTAVQRTMVIDGSLWTLSPERLQSNDVTTLDRTAAIDLT